MEHSGISFRDCEQCTRELEQRRAACERSMKRQRLLIDFTASAAFLIYILTALAVIGAGAYLIFFENWLFMVPVVVLAFLSVAFLSPTLDWLFEVIYKPLERRLIRKAGE